MITGNVKAITINFTKQKNFVPELMSRLRAEIETQITNIHSQAVNNLNSNESVNTGNLRASLYPYKENKGYTWYIWPERGKTKQAKHGAFIEFGTKPHKPPIQPLIDWVHQKGLGSTYSVTTKRRTGKKGNELLKSEKRIAGAIQRKISRYGTKAKPFLIPAFNKFYPIYRVNIKNILQSYNLKIE